MIRANIRFGRSPGKRVVTGYGAAVRVPATQAGDNAQGASGANPVRPSGAQAAAQVEIRELRAQLGESRATVEDLRHRLDEERAERRQTAERLAAAQERIAALLTDQRATPAPARRSWWRWGQRA